MKLPSRPPWYREMVARLRAERSAGDTSPSEFLEHAADEIERRHQDGDPYLRSLVRRDVAAYDRAVSAEQRADASDAAASEDAARWIKASLIPDDILIKLGLDPEIELGFGRKARTLDATHEERAKAIAELRRQLGNANKGIQRRIDALEQADDMAGGKTLREIIDNRPEEYGDGTVAL